ncbi:unnamed protein product [Urochloa humidicola]
MQILQYFSCVQVNHGEQKHVNHGGSLEFAVPVKDALTAVPNWSAGTSWWSGAGKGASVESGISALRLYFLNYIVHLPNPNICPEGKAKPDMTLPKEAPRPSMLCHHFHTRPMAG